MSGKSFLASLFDLSFEHCITIKMIKLLYAVAIAGSVLSGLAVLGMGLSEGGFLGLIGGLFGGVITAVLSLIVSRLWLELIIVIFRIADHTSIMCNQNTE